MRFILVVYCLLFALPTQALANFSDIKKNISPREFDVWKNQIPQFTKKYNETLANLYKNPRKIKENMRMLRSYYPRTKQYSPFSKKILDDITRHVMTIEEASDNIEINDALSLYKELVGKHLANLDVASFALTMARLDTRFGDEVFYLKVKNALIGVFNRGGLGRSAETAYNIITYSEETYILKHISRKIESSQIFEINDRYYNVHEIIDKNDRYRQVFISISQPIKNTLYNQMVKDRENSLSLTPF